MDAPASPICAQAMNPPLITSSGLMPKKPGFHSTRSASFPVSTDPTASAKPCEMAGLIVYFATYRLMRRLSLSPRSPGSRPRCSRILCAVCQVRVITSPTRPIAWLSLDIMLIAPRSCRMSSAAMVSPRIRLSAKATSSTISRSRWWQTINMSRCSSRVLTVKGRVGFVDDGSTSATPQTRRMSGACPPPAPSEW